MKASGCRDIDECNKLATCPDNSFCLNTPGNYSCECFTGFEGRLCTDIDECSMVGQCHSNATCSNSAGSFECSCNTGHHGNGISCVLGDCDDNSCPYNNAKCTSPTTDKCDCKKGFMFNDDINICEDIKECLVGNECHANATCDDSEGSYSCNCNIGFIGDGKMCQEGSCTEDICPLNQECVSPTTHDCQCKNGFERNETDFCVDTDECTSNKNNCDKKALCENTIGGYDCFCNTGYTGNGYSSCLDNDECGLGEHNCHKKAKCTNTDGSFSCSCKYGLYGNGTTCSNNACTTGDHNCHAYAECSKVKKSFSCSCKRGYYGNGTSCLDSDDCPTGSHECHTEATCRLTKEKFANFTKPPVDCSCKKGFVGNGYSCSDVDECISKNDNGYDVHDCAEGSKCTNTIGSFSCSCLAEDENLCRHKWFLVLGVSVSRHMLSNQRNFQGSCVTIESNSV